MNRPELNCGRRDLHRLRALRALAAHWPLILLAACVACGPAATRDAARVRLMVPSTERPVWEALARTFMADHPGATVDVVEGPTATDQREDLYTAALMAGDGSFDLVYMDVTWTAKFAGAGWLRPLDGEFSQAQLGALLPVAVDTGRLEGRLYRVPVRTDVGLLYYRRDWLDEAGLEPPGSFEELERIASRLQQAPDRWGFVWQGLQYEGLACVFLEVLTGHGGFWVDDGSLDVGLDRKEAHAALAFLIRMRTSGLSPPGVTTYKEEESRRIFQDGRAVFLRGWPYMWQLAQRNDSPVRGKVGVIPMVHTKEGRAAGTLGGWGLGISYFSRQSALALAFIRHVISIEGQRTLCATSGYAPVRTDAYSDPALVSANPLLAELAPRLLAAVPRPVIPHYAMASDILQRYLSRALAGRQSVDDALNAAARETRQLLEPERARRARGQTGD